MTGAKIFTDRAESTWPSLQGTGRPAAVSISSGAALAAPRPGRQNVADLQRVIIISNMVPSIGRKRFCVKDVLSSAYAGPGQAIREGDEGALDDTRRHPHRMLVSARDFGR